MVNGTTLEVLYFARVAELTGVREESWPISGPISAHEWLSQLEARYPRLAPVARLKLAINQQHSSHDSTLNPGDEVAVFDPVTGG